MVAQTRLAQHLVVLGHDARDREGGADDDVLDDRPLEEDEKVGLGGTVAQAAKRQRERLLVLADKDLLLLVDVITNVL